MARLEEQRFELRDFLGVDRTANARVNSPGSFFTLEDLWMPQAGILQQRPGTTEFASKVVVGRQQTKNDPNGWSDPPDEFGHPGVLNNLNPEITVGLKFSFIGTRFQIPPVITTVPGINLFNLPVSNIGDTIFGASF